MDEIGIRIGMGLLGEESGERFRCPRKELTNFPEKFPKKNCPRWSLSPYLALSKPGTKNFPDKFSRENCLVGIFRLKMAIVKNVHRTNCT